MLVLFIYLNFLSRNNGSSNNPQLDDVSRVFKAESPPPTAEYTPKPLKRGRPRTVTSEDAILKSAPKRHCAKSTEEYRDKRDRNNVAVRKSRQRSRQKQSETEDRVQSLQAQNSALQKKVDLLSKELNVLKSLFTNVGAPPGPTN